MEIKNLKKAAQRIIVAIKSKEKIILYGDADLDGVSSVLILKETLKTLGGEIPAIYFPDREKEGYGLNVKALNYLKNEAPSLLITLDCGIGNFEEIKLAKKLGFEVIIVDHHQVLNKIPQASIVVDPKQKGDEYPFKELANAAIAFKLSQALLGKKLTQSLKENFLELVALATIADQMPRIEENQIFIEEGIRSLRNSWRPGLRAFLKINLLKSCKNFQEFIQRIISSLNTADVKNHLTGAYLLLTQKDEETAEYLVKGLLEKSSQRKVRIREINREVEERILKKSEEIVFEGASDWSLTLLGPVASRICQKYKKPTFLFQKGQKESQGAVRIPQGLDGVKAMGTCPEILETYGGHPPACGFRIKNENLEQFKKRLIEYFSKR
ncbi:DHH family phosphoesterase [Patescibacteria group bacterium]|nr:DHH family phosphoesterase [Patescibacteria group bacterium]